MRTALCHSVFIIPLILVLVLGAGCEGGGLDIKVALPDSGDQPGGDTDGGGGGGGGGDTGGDTNGGAGGGGTSSARFAGNWIASFSDDRTTSSAQYGQIQYAASLKIQQNDTSISGSGILFRVFREGPTASNRISVQMTGTASGDDAIFTLRSGSGGLDRDQTWYVRLAGSRLAGMYVAVDGTGTLARSGHAVWRKASTGVPDSTPWAAAYTDEFGYSGFPQYSRTASVTPVITEAGLSGAGTFYEHGRVPPGVNFDITRGGISGTEVGLTFGGLDLLENEVDWFGFFGGSIMETAYAQFDASDSMIRFGHTTWVLAPEQAFTAISGAWAGSFCDRTIESPNQPEDFVAILNLSAETGGAVSGYALIRDEADDQPSFLRYNIESGSMIGTQVQLSMSRLTGSFFWDLRLAQGLLVGSYQRFIGSQDRPISTGHAEFRIMTSAGTLRGTWASAYVDTFGAVEPEQSQLAVITVSNQASVNAPFSGFGALRFAGESRRRLFNVTGEVAAGDIVWQWRGADLFGDTIWHLRRCGDLLYGSYTNYTAGGAIESRGVGMWARSSYSASFEQ
ncbi:MAG TPA: hypothetical protein PKY01_05945 [Candidatus Hydrogenedentes bacterium]|nr:hypothetical protein [Candidatus Hydrogenedentota bacterium]HQH51947.1 hypothetical protein [Candidatus Hydrogenedentota bacterium]HQM48625.1 hypothetical protein [Candidatus Hydrogenedentota bacterium]